MKKWNKESRSFLKIAVPGGILCLLLCAVFLNLHNVKLFNGDFSNVDLSGGSEDSSATVSGGEFSDDDISNKGVSENISANITDTNISENVSDVNTSENITNISENDSEKNAFGNVSDTDRSDGNITDSISANTASDEDVFNTASADVNRDMALETGGEPPISADSSGDDSDLSEVRVSSGEADAGDVSDADTWDDSDSGDLEADAGDAIEADAGNVDADNSDTGDSGDGQDDTALLPGTDEKGKGSGSARGSSSSASSSSMSSSGKNREKKDGAVSKAGNKQYRKPVNRLSTSSGWEALEPEEILEKWDLEAPHEGFVVLIPEEEQAGLAALEESGDAEGSGLERVSGNMFRTEDEELARSLLLDGTASISEPDYVVYLMDLDEVDSESSLEAGFSALTEEAASRAFSEEISAALTEEAAARASSEEVTAALTEEAVLAASSDANHGWPYEKMLAAYSAEYGLDGSGVRVGIIDSGVDLNNIDLQEANIVQGYNRYEEIDGVAMTDDNYHGSRVAQIIAADENDIGGTGLSRGVEIVPIRCFQNGGGGTISVLSEMLYKAVDEFGCDVVNMSWGLTTDSAILYDAVKHAYDEGVLLVASSGNVNSSFPQGSILYPAAYPEVISVTSVRSNLGYYSNAMHNAYVDVCAPGYAIMLIDAEGGIRSSTGTSFACPCVVSVMAIMRQLMPMMDNDTIYEILKERAVDLGSAGRDDLYGYGFVNLEELLGMGWQEIRRPDELHETEEVYWEPTIEEDAEINDGEAGLSGEEDTGDIDGEASSELAGSGSDADADNGGSVGSGSASTGSEEETAGISEDTGSGDADASSKGNGQNQKVRYVVDAALVRGWFLQKDVGSLSIVIYDVDGSMRGSAVIPGNGKFVSFSDTIRIKTSVSPDNYVGSSMAAFDACECRFFLLDENGLPLRQAASDGF